MFQIEMEDGQRGENGQHVQRAVRLALSPVPVTVLTLHLKGMDLAVGTRTQIARSVMNSNALVRELLYFCLFTLWFYGVIVKVGRNRCPLQCNVT